MSNCLHSKGGANSRMAESFLPEATSDLARGHRALGITEKHLPGVPQRQAVVGGCGDQRGRGAPTPQV